jgi:hypothetical protein
MAQRTQKYALGGGTAVALVGLALLIASFAILVDGSDGLLAINGPPFLFIAAMLALRIGVLMSERYLCSTCGVRVTRSSSHCPGCDEPLFG